MVAKATKAGGKKSTMLDPKVSFKIYGAGGFELGAPMSIGPNWQPNHIRYYKMGLNTTGGLQFAYAETTGVAILNDDPINYETNIDDFVDSVVAGEPDVVPFSQSESAPDLVARDACYIVIELDANPGWRFTCRRPSIKTVRNCSDIYFGLAHVDTYGTRYNGQNNSQKNAVCRVAYFGVNLGARAPAKINPTEKFSLFIETERGFRDCVPIILDPDIRNDGGSNPGFYDKNARKNVRLTRMRETTTLAVARKKSGRP